MHLSSGACHRIYQRATRHDCYSGPPSAVWARRSPSQSPGETKVVSAPPRTAREDAPRSALEVLWSAPVTVGRHYVKEKPRRRVRDCSPSARTAQTRTMRDLFIALSILCVYWYISLFVRTARAATARLRELADRFLSTARFHFRLFGLEFGTIPTCFQVLVRAVRWILAVGRRVHYIYSSVIVPSKATFARIAWPRRWCLASDIFHMCLQVYQRTHMPVKVDARSYEFILDQARSAPWMVVAFGVGLPCICTHRLLNLCRSASWPAFWCFHSAPRWRHGRGLFGWWWDDCEATLGIE